MGYLYVDRILEIQRGGGPGGISSSRGIKWISRWDPFLRPGAGGLELSPCLAGEALGQLAAWVAMREGGFSRRPVAGLTSEALVGRAGRPGDLLLLEVQMESLEEDAVHYHGRASIDGEMVLELRHAVGPMLPMEEFDDPAVVERQFHELCRESPGELPGDRSSPGDPGGQPDSFTRRPPGEHPVIDAILERHEDRILAVTCVSPEAPYLVGHFPRKPVLPATLLLDGQIQLAQHLARGHRAGEPRVARLLNLKMRSFVRPGSRLLSEIKIKERGPDRMLVDLSSRMENRPVSSGVVELV